MTPAEHSGRMAGWLETAWLQRYLERQLDADEEAWFEAYLMDKADLIERLEVDTELRDGLTYACDRGDAPGSTETVPGTMNAPTAGSAVSSPATPLDVDRSARRNPRQRRAYLAPLGLAATLVAGVGAGWFTAARNQAPKLIASPMRIVYDTVRGEPSLPLVEHADSESPYVLIEVAVPANAKHIRLRTAEGEHELTASPDGFVTFLISKEQQAAVLRLDYESEGREQTRVLNKTR